MDADELTGARAAAAGPLTAGQLGRYERDGYLLLPPGFAPGLVEAAAAVLPRALAQEGDARILERDGTTVRTVYGLHRTQPAIAGLARRPELLGAVGQLLGDDVYVHQSKINVKAPFLGDQWEWHQDFVYWLRGDGIQLPDLVNVAVFLDEVTEFNGPLTFVPGSHRAGLLAGVSLEGMPRGYEEAPAWVATLTANEQFRISPEIIEDLARRNGLVSPKGPSGSVLLFHPNILHCSGANISPFRRSMLMFVYNSVRNRPHPVTAPRPDFLAEPDVVALEPLPA